MYHRQHSKTWVILNRCNFPYDRRVSILVGAENERFEVHRGLVCKYPFFKAVFEGNFQESDGTLTLPKHDPGTFRYLVYWLCTGKLDGHFYPSNRKPAISELRAVAETASRYKIPYIGSRKEIKILELEGPYSLFNLARFKDQPFDALVNLHLLAEYLQVGALKDSVINSLVDVYGFHSDDRETCFSPFWVWTSKRRPTWIADPVSSINTAWKWSPKDSNLCRLLVTLFCDEDLDDLDAFQEVEHLSAGFLSAAYSKVSHRRRKGEAETDWESPGALCAYHDHDGVPCKAHDTVV
ncbi:MAG: hypothetical protein Q9222_001184 [Ikaeria aurantiellina]